MSSQRPKNRNTLSSKKQLLRVTTNTQRTCVHTSQLSRFLLHLYSREETCRSVSSHLLLSLNTRLYLCLSEDIYFREYLVWKLFIMILTNISMSTVSQEPIYSM